MTGIWELEIQCVPIFTTTPTPILIPPFTPIPTTPSPTETLEIFCDDISGGLWRGERIEYQFIYDNFGHVMQGHIQYQLISHLILHLHHLASKPALQLLISYHHREQLLLAELFLIRLQRQFL